MIYQADFVTNIYNFSYLRFLIAQIWATACYLHIKDCDWTAHVHMDNCILNHVQQDEGGDFDENDDFEDVPRTATETYQMVLNLSDFEESYGKHIKSWSFAVNPHWRASFSIHYDQDKVFALDVSFIMVVGA